jgi:hypothetical protein
MESRAKLFGQPIHRMLMVLPLGRARRFGLLDSGSNMIVIAAFDLVTPLQHRRAG